MQKNCQKCKREFRITEEDKNFYEMLQVPEPTFCPECRLQRRLAFRNDRTLYKRDCEMCKQSVISIYRPNGGIKVVCQKCWWSDDFNPTQYGRDYDFSKTFFEQYQELMKDVPFVANFIVDESRMINSPYNNMALDLRNCYMLFDADYNEDCSYGCEIENSRNCFDTNLIEKGEMCYECVNMTNCYRAFFSLDCENSSDIWFSKDCNGCLDCFGCVNLRNKNYYIFNEPMGNKEAYQAKLQELGLTSRANLEELRKKIKEEVWDQGITKYMHEKQNDDVTGDYIYNSKNVHDSWIVHEGRNVRYSQYLVAPNVKDTYDLTQFGSNIERFYEVLQGGNGGSNVRFSWFAVNENTSIDYCMQVMTSKEMFGCIGIRKGEYCILNKQYSKEEYESLRAKIIEQMTKLPYVDKNELAYSYGEFFPSELSPFAYNETTTQEFFSLSREQMDQQGFTYFEREKRNYQPTLKLENIPDDASEIPETITNEILECVNGKSGVETCTTAFRVITDEAGFYTRFNLPIPNKCPNCRHEARMKLRTIPRFHTLTCQNCNKEIMTAYDESTPNLFCKECYLQTVV